MRRKTPLLIALFVVVVGAVLGATVLREPLAAAATTPFQNVVVVNSASQPIPTQVTGPVTVQPRLTNQFNFSARLDLDDPIENFTVPAGKVLVVEHLNVSALADSDRLIS